MFVYRPPFLALTIRSFLTTSHYSVSVIHSHYFYYHISRQNYTATEDGIKYGSTEEFRETELSIDVHYLPSQNEHSSSIDRIINRYDFVAVNERMEESLVVLSMVAAV